jgi:tetratricopeptide (TPR) repeat protein
MMAKRKKVSRKKLLKEPDEFITFSGKLIQFGMQHQKQITYGIGILAALIVIVAGYRFFSARSENKAMLLLNQAVAKYEMTIKTGDANQAYQSVAEDFQNVLNQYENRDGGKLAGVIFANICFDAGEYNRSIELYTKALDDFKSQPIFLNLILSGLGYAYEQINENERAASYFEKIVASKNQALHAEALFNLGVLYEKLGQTQKSEKAFGQITSDYPDSIYIDIVKERSAG